MPIPPGANSAPTSLADAPKKSVIPTQPKSVIPTGASAPSADAQWRDPSSRGAERSKSKRGPSITVGKTNFGAHPIVIVSAPPPSSFSPSFFFSSSFSYLVIPTGASAPSADAQWRDLSSPPVIPSVVEGPLFSSCHPDRSGGTSLLLLSSRAQSRDLSSPPVIPTVVEGSLFAFCHPERSRGTSLRLLSSRP